ncbi:GIY-YIG nuclease family protein [Gordonia soli]|uniref:GIY-YIG domain-containing protein n=1 Tax=Gordonia soli NBRC 108243 TaxID=1223545 RepID=M0QFB2_9ACTN|nr:GIY-YIG nuclease family protein [Gordonia soli]GAC67290.1 hypothetical protein GS4_07_00390 [Gordonia soli NBRC 108243]
MSLVEAVELPRSAMGTFLDSPTFAELMVPPDERAELIDPRVRTAEVVDVLHAIDRFTGRRFVSRERAGELIFGGLLGGGIGIREEIVEGVLDLLEPVTVPGPARFAPIPLEAQDRLGVYVYALLDPRDGEVFYVGAGRGSRVYQHVWSALAGTSPDPSEVVGTPDPAEVTSATTDRITDIDADGFGVEHWILRHGIGGEDDTDTDDGRGADVMRQALTDLAGIAGIELVADVDGDDPPSAGGARRAEELALRYSAPLAPPLPDVCAVVKVNAAADPDASAEQLYEWSRSGWRAGRHRAVDGLPVFVVADDIIRAVHRVEHWEPFVDEHGVKVARLWTYSGAPDVESEGRYVGTSLREVRVQRSDGRWTRHGWHPYGQVG